MKIWVNTGALAGEEEAWGLGGAKTADTVVWDGGMGGACPRMTPSGAAGRQAEKAKTGRERANTGRSMAIPSSGWRRVTSVSPEDAQVRSDTVRAMEAMILQKPSEIGAKMPAPEWE